MCTGPHIKIACLSYDHDLLELTELPFTEGWFFCMSQQRSLANGRWCYKSNVFSHWLTLCSANSKTTKRNEIRTRKFIYQYPCKHAISCQNWARIILMLPTASRCWQHQADCDPILACFTGRQGNHSNCKLLWMEMPFYSGVNPNLCITVCGDWSW